MRIQSAAYFLDFSDSRNLAFRATRTPVFGTLFFNNFVMRNSAEPMDPNPTFTAACRGGLVAAFLRCRLPSICRGMREVGAAGCRSRRQGTTAGYGRNAPAARRQERNQTCRPTRRLTGPLAIRRCHSFVCIGPTKARRVSCEPERATRILTRLARLNHSSTMSAHHPTGATAGGTFPCGPIVAGSVFSGRLLSVL